MKAIRDSINKGITTEKTQRTKADSIIQILGNTTRNQKMGDLMIRDMRKNYDVRKDIPNFKMPILIISGQQDPVGVFPAFAIRELNKQSTICWIEKSRHFPFLEQPEAFYKCLYDFLK